MKGQSAVSAHGQSTPAAFSGELTATGTSAHRIELFQAGPTPASGRPPSDGETEALAPTLSCLVMWRSFCILWRYLHAGSQQKTVGRRDGKMRGGGAVGSRQQGGGQPCFSEMGNSGVLASFVLARSTCLVIWEEACMIGHQTGLHEALS